MSAAKKSKNPSEMSPEQLKQLDTDTLVGLLTSVLEQNRQLTELLQQVIREKHGPKTERFENPDQLRLFGAASEEQAQTSEASSDSSASTSGSTAKPPSRKKGHTRNPMPAHLERKRITGQEPAVADLVCGKCAGSFELLMEIVRNSRYEQVPASVVIEDFTALIYQCAGCSETLTVEPPQQSIENGIAGPCLLIDIAVSKFEDHLPWNRQEQRFARIGVPIARSTMVGWMQWLANRLRPLYNRMRELLLLSKVIATDDTPVKVQDRSLRRKLSHKLQIKTGRIWIYRGDDDHPFNVFHYTEGRARAGPMTFLKAYDGFLQGDCFSGNLALCAETGATFVACLVHARRYFIKAEPNNKAACQEILQMFFDIFKIERDARELELSADDVKLMREQESKPILDKMKTWLNTQALIALPKSSFGKAVNYCLNNWIELTNYLLDGNLRADNNLAEQEMKRIACGRKNWYFLGSDEGGKTAEVLLSIMSTCRRHCVNPSEYLKDVLQILSENPVVDLDSLLPHNWKQRKAKSEIDRCHSTPKVIFA